MTRRAFTFLASLVVALDLTLAAPAAADTIRLAGSAIPLQDCTIEDIRAGRVYFSGRRGRRQWREEEEVAALGFAGLHALDEAEAKLDRDGFDVALPRFVAALLAAKTDVQRVWIHARLARLHDNRGHWALAATHAAQVFMIREDRAWLRLEPLCPPAVSTAAAAREAWRTLAEAERKVRTPVLRQSIAKMQETLRSVSPTPPGEGPPTLSGLRLDDARITGVARPATPVSAKGDATLIDIDTLIGQERYRDALAALSPLLEDPGSAPLDGVLLAAGRALRGVGRGRDAAVMFTRCAILFDDTPAAGWAWYETALVYRDVIRNDERARRLLARAHDAATRTGDRRLAAAVAAAGEDSPDPSSDDG